MAHQGQSHDTRSSVDAIDFLASARTLAPVLRQRASHCESLRRVPAETIAELSAAGFFDMLKPLQFGGHEADPYRFLEVCIEVSRHCASSAWVLGILGVHAWRLALFPDRAAAEVWRDKTMHSELIAASSPPSGRADRVEGGYRIRGRWPFASGVDHCGWALLAVDVPVTEGSEHTFQYFFLVPRSDFAIEDVWHAAGLKGTGTNLIVVDDVFVPEYRTSSEADAITQRVDPHCHCTGPCYRYPWGLMLAYAISAPAIGMALAAVDIYTDFVRGKLKNVPRTAEGNPFAHLLIARVKTTLECVQLKLRKNFGGMRQTIESGAKVPLPLRAKYRWEASWMTESCVAIVREVFEAMGGSAVLDGNPIQRLFRDAEALKAHRINDVQATGSNFGRVEAGLANREFFL